MATALQSLAGIAASAIQSWQAAQSAWGSADFGAYDKRATLSSFQAAMAGAIASVDAVTSVASGESFVNASGETCVQWTNPKSPLVVWLGKDGQALPTFGHALANYALVNSASLVL
jgi:hypothetical protein